MMSSRSTSASRPISPASPGRPSRRREADRRFLAKWDRLRADALTRDGPRRIVIVGGGVAGLCLAFAVTAALRRSAVGRGLDPAAFQISLVSSGPPPEVNPGMRRAVDRALARHGIDVAGGEASAVDAGRVTLSDGRRVPADAVLVATQAAPPPSLRDACLAKDERGFLAIRPTLQVNDADDVFAAGDCATMPDHPRPKAGVYAVRQGPHLAANLRRRLRGEPLSDFIPRNGTSSCSRRRTGAPSADAAAGCGSRAAGLGG